MLHLLAVYGLGCLQNTGENTYMSSLIKCFIIKLYEYLPRLACLFGQKFLALGNKMF